MRVLTLLWIIVIHSYNFSFQWVHFDNTQQVKDIYTSLWTQWIANGTFSVDNFLLVSGLLASMRSIRADHPDNVVKSIVRRYARLVPSMVAAILISKYLLQNMGSGPNWTNATVMFDLWCRQNKWVLNSLGLHNFISTSDMCFSHSWYIAVELQLFVIVQLLQYLLLNRLSIGLRNFCFSLIAFCICSQSYVSFLIYLFDLPPMPLLPANSDTAMNEYYGRLYIKPFYWLASYTSGVILGHILSHQLALRTSKESHTVRGRTNKLISCTRRLNLHLPNVCLLVLVILLTSNLSYFRSKQPMDTTVAASYAFFVRPLWSISMCMIIYRMQRRREKLNWLRRLRSFLSRPMWCSLNRLSYAAYLLHPIVMAWFYGSRTETFVMTHGLLFYFAIGNIVSTYLAALLFYLLIELPLNRTFKLLIP